mmetsp:Transcript_69109/g.156261  ORF Transcript_69109/g.156261 Transcript_69109/m.156261 type:complete len:227 (+) Transcript_69109:102-782(+)
MSKVSFVPTGGRPANVGVGVTRSRIVLKSESGARLGPSRPQTTPGGLSTAELTRGQGTTAFSFSREKREVASSNLVTTRDHFQRRPYLEYAEEAPDHGRKPPRFKGGSWAPLREEKPHNKLPAVDPDDFQPISRVVAAREAASSTSLRDLKRRKQQAKLKAYRPVPLTRSTLFTDCSGPGSGIGMGYKGGFDAVRAAGGTSHSGARGGSFGSITPSKAYFHRAPTH